MLVLTKQKAAQSNSRYAQGGIAAVWDPEDKFEAHSLDTLDAGKGLCDEAIVDLVVREAPGCVRDLMAWGTEFDQVNGSVLLGREGGHSASRIIHALGDATGLEIIRAVLGRLEERRHIELLEDVFIIDLLTHEGRCVGALTWHPDRGVQSVWAAETILATGGCGQLYRETTNPTVATGDGMAMAYRAGAKLMDMEFMQFHPPCSVAVWCARYRGQRVKRVLTTRGHVSWWRHPPSLPLATVSRAIIAQMAKTRHRAFISTCRTDADSMRRARIGGGMPHAAST